MKGVIQRLFVSNAYGFIMDDAGNSRFFHKEWVEPPEAFDHLFQGMRVDFDPGEGIKGLQALRVRKVDV